ncbi:MAG: YebC/PmpR family DNA-binding transcriptional regulator [Candidatus Moranbacteria bacterium]|jgi:YebC/PmpR family DNA-binding regulatory protein|nr:YebC/PmpR family DNA-binding transcriptional regulator [Candidatus Moranbacteria bacterium]MBP9801317.1 YebC/PmpR family DNA-binding transcriptional regulator [Candidatus Moranbacteria bacterium]
MSGHSHWAGIRHKKGINDAKRGAIFTKHGRLITIAAREGIDPAMNFKLRLAVDTARSMNMPKENIDRAIKAGSGELKDGTVIDSVLYEAYGPNQVALLIEGLTDNKNRSVGDVKTILTKNGGKFVPTGSVSFMFRHVGIIVFALEKYSAETLELETLDSGADDFRLEEEVFLVITHPENLQAVRTYFVSRNFEPESAELGYLPTQTISLSPADLEKYEKLKELLEDHQDVQTVWDNLA